MKLSEIVALIGLSSIVFISGGVVGAVTYREFAPPKIIYEKGAAPAAVMPHVYTVDSGTVLNSEQTSALTFKKGHPLTYVSADKIVTDASYKANTLFKGFDSAEFGKEVKLLDDIKSRYVLLVFSDVMCPHCRKNMDSLRKVRDKYKREDLEIVIATPPVSNAQFAEVKNSEFEKKLKTMGETEKADFLEKDFTRFNFVTFSSDADLMSTSQMYEVHEIPLAFLIKNTGIVPKVTLRYEGPLLFDVNEKVTGLSEEKVKENVLKIEKAFKDI